MGCQWGPPEGLLVPQGPLPAAWQCQAGCLPPSPQEGSWSHPSPFPWDGGVLLCPAADGTLKHPPKHTENPWEFQQRELWHSRSIPSLSRCDAGWVPLLHPCRATHARGRGCASVGSPAPRFEHPAPHPPLPAPAPTGGVAPSAGMVARPRREAGKWISRAPLTFLLPSL